jgi:hypothetical protein
MASRNRFTTQEALMAVSARRDFLGAAGGVLLLRPQTAFGSQANSAIEVGLVGCGGRGNWIAPFFPEHAGARVVALGDVIRKNLDDTREKLQVDPARAYWGPDANAELAASKVDAVVISLPAGFPICASAASVCAAAPTRTTVA